MRNWPASYLVSKAQNSAVAGKFGIALLPGGKAGRASALGGASLSVSRYSRNPRDAAELVRFLCRRDTQFRRSLVTTQPPTLPELYEEPEVLKADPHFALLKQAQASTIVVRPSAETGKNYTAVSEAYFNAVYSVLTGQKKAATAAAELETKLVQITGFKKRAPGADAVSTAQQFAPAR